MLVTGLVLRVLFAIGLIGCVVLVGSCVLLVVCVGLCGWLVFMFYWFDSCLDSLFCVVCLWVSLVLLVCWWLFLLSLVLRDACGCWVLMIC